MDRRELLKRTGAISAGAALGGVPAAGLGIAAVAAQTEDFDVWTTYTDEARAGIIEGLGTTFGEANGLTFTHRAWSQDELMDTLPRSVDSDQGPDVAQVNNGENLAGPMARAGQIVSLAEYEAEYGWSERFAEGLLARCRYSADGVTFGEGDLWGLPAESEIVGFFYNRQVFADNGLSIPTTFEEFEELLAALRAASIEPLVFGSLDAWQLIHLFGEIHGTNTTREYLDDLIYRRGTVDFTDPSILWAAEKVIEWNDAGYFMEGYDGITGDESTALFASGVGAILMQGTWAAGQVAADMGDNAGFFLMPPMSGGAVAATPVVAEATPVASGGVLHVGGVGTPFSITANAADPAVAASFIDSLVSEEAFAAFVEAGSLPLGQIPADLIQDGTLSGDIYSNWNTALQQDGLGHFMDWAAPGFYDFFTAALQELLGGQVTAAEFQANIQEFYAASFA